MANLATKQILLSVLKKYTGDYLEIPKDSLKAELGSLSFRFRNVRIKPQGFRNLDLPPLLAIKGGILGELFLDFPAIMRLKDDPVKMTITDLSLLIGPNTEHAHAKPVDQRLRKEMAEKAFELKMKSIDDIQRVEREQLLSMDSPEEVKSAEGSTLESYLVPMIQNAIITIENIFIRYEIDKKFGGENLAMEARIARIHLFSGKGRRGPPLTSEVIGNVSNVDKERTLERSNSGSLTPVSPGTSVPSTDDRSGNNGVMVSKALEILNITVELKQRDVKLIGDLDIGEMYENLSELSKYMVIENMDPIAFKICPLRQPDQYLLTPLTLFVEASYWAHKPSSCESFPSLNVHARIQSINIVANELQISALTSAVLALAIHQSQTAALMRTSRFSESDWWKFVAGSTISREHRAKHSCRWGNMDPLLIIEDMKSGLNCSRTALLMLNAQKYTADRDLYRDLYLRKQDVYWVRLKYAALTRAEMKQLEDMERQLAVLEILHFRTIVESTLQRQAIRRGHRFWFDNECLVQNRYLFGKMFTIAGLEAENDIDDDDDEWEAVQIDDVAFNPFVLLSKGKNLEDLVLIGSLNIMEVSVTLYDPPRKNLSSPSIILRLIIGFIDADVSYRKRVQNLKFKLMTLSLTDESSGNIWPAFRRIIAPKTCDFKSPLLHGRVEIVWRDWFHHISADVNLSRLEIILNFPLILKVLDLITPMLRLMQDQEAIPSETSNLPDSSNKNDSTSSSYRLESLKLHADCPIIMIPEDVSKSRCTTLAVYLGVVSFSLKSNIDSSLAVTMSDALVDGPGDSSTGSTYLIFDLTLERLCIAYLQGKSDWLCQRINVSSISEMFQSVIVIDFFIRYMSEAFPDNLNDLFFVIALEWDRVLGLEACPSAAFEAGFEIRQRAIFTEFFDRGPLHNTDLVKYVASAVERVKVSITPKDELYRTTVQNLFEWVNHGRGVFEAVHSKILVNDIQNFFSKYRSGHDSSYYVDAVTLSEYSPPELSSVRRSSVTESRRFKGHYLLEDVDVAHCHVYSTNELFVSTSAIFVTLNQLSLRLGVSDIMWCMRVGFGMYGALQSRLSWILSKSNERKTSNAQVKAPADQTTFNSRLSCIAYIEKGITVTIVGRCPGGAADTPLLKFVLTTFGSPSCAVCAPQQPGMPMKSTSFSFNSMNSIDGKSLQSKVKPLLWFSGDSVQQDIRMGILHVALYEMTQSTGTVNRLLEISSAAEATSHTGFCDMKSATKSSKKSEVSRRRRNTVLDVTESRSVTNFKRFVDTDEILTEDRDSIAKNVYGELKDAVENFEDVLISLTNAPEVVTAPATVSSIFMSVPDTSSRTKPAGSSLIHHSDVLPSWAGHISLDVSVKDLTVYIIIGAPKIGLHLEINIFHCISIIAHDIYSELFTLLIKHDLVSSTSQKKHSNFPSDHDLEMVDLNPDDGALQHISMFVGKIIVQLSVATEPQCLLKLHDASLFVMVEPMSTTVRGLVMRPLVYDMTVGADWPGFIGRLLLSPRYAYQDRCCLNFGFTKYMPNHPDYPLIDSTEPFQLLQMHAHYLKIVAVTHFFDVLIPKFLFLGDSAVMKEPLLSAMGPTSGPAPLLVLDIRVIDPEVSVVIFDKTPSQEILIEGLVSSDGMAINVVNQTPSDFLLDAFRQVYMKKTRMPIVPEPFYFSRPKIPSADDALYSESLLGGYDLSSSSIRSVRAARGTSKSVSVISNSLDASVSRSRSSDRATKETRQLASAVDDHSEVDEKVTEELFLKNMTLRQELDVSVKEFEKLNRRYLALKKELEIKRHFVENQRDEVREIFRKMGPSWEHRSQYNVDMSYVDDHDSDVDVQTSEVKSEGNIVRYKTKAVNYCFQFIQVFWACIRCQTCQSENRKTRLPVTSRKRGESEAVKMPVLTNGTSTVGYRAVVK